MSGWGAMDDRVFALPSGRLIRRRGLRALPELAPDPDFGLYLLATPVQGVPWAHVWVEWPDFGLPADPESADRAMIAAWGRTVDGRVEVACMGGVGRTGTVLACMTALDGLHPAAAIEHVRAAYDPAAVETAEQVGYVTRFTAAHCG